MIESPWILVAATLLGATAIWLLLPRPRTRSWPLGVLLGAISLGLLASQVPRLGRWDADAILLVLAAVTVVAAAATISFRNSVYSAIWFALSLLGAAGLFLVQGAQFLAVATVIVYAGAILVTFLFLLMLADPQGRAYYDRVGWETAVSAFTGAVIVGILSMTTVSVLRSPPQSFMAAAATAEERAEGVLSEYPMAMIGESLFSRHLIAVEVAGTLLLAALVGAAAMVAHGHGGRTPQAPGVDGRKPAVSIEPASAADATKSHHSEPHAAGEQLR